MPKALFEQLDLDGDGQLSRSELYEAAMSLGWGWHEAPFFALIDLLTIRGPISKDQFNGYLNQAVNDPLGPYGSVLRNSPLFHSPTGPGNHRTTPTGLSPGQVQGIANDQPQSKPSLNTERISRFLPGQTGLVSGTLARDASIVIILDPQRAFTRGIWMRSIGPGAEADVEPIKFAFRQCAAFLGQNDGKMPVMLTRCPFPPESYQWDDQLAEIISPNQLYIIKPGNSVLFPPGNGFTEWVENWIEKGRLNLIIGGCTLNSCVRMSAIETLNAFKHKNLRVIVDLNLCGARARNFEPSQKFKGVSAVASAVEQMQEAGVNVVNGVKWIGEN